MGATWMDVGAFAFVAEFVSGMVAECDKRGVDCWDIVVDFCGWIWDVDFKGSFGCSV